MSSLLPLKLSSLHFHMSEKGRIDDSRDPSKATYSDLENALEDILANRTVRVPETKPFGCAIVHQTRKTCFDRQSSQGKFPASTPGFSFSLNARHYYSV